MEKHHKFSIWYVFLGIWAVLILHNLLVSTLSVRTIPYSEFLELLKQGKVSEVAITSNQIQGKMGAKPAAYRPAPFSDRARRPGFVQHSRRVQRDV